MFSTIVTGFDASPQSHDALVLAQVLHAAPCEAAACPVLITPRGSAGRNLSETDADATIAYGS